jgi:predicted XRE-type DNA-binding protein
VIVLKIKSEQEYLKIKKQVEELEKERAMVRKELEERGADENFIRLAEYACGAFYDEFKAQLREYEKVVAGQFEKDVVPLHQLGSHLVKLRIWKGISQSELAKRLGVSQPQISKDERFEYQGISIEKANRILQALGVEKLTVIPGKSMQTVGAKDEMASTNEKKAI